MFQTPTVDGYCCRNAGRWIVAKGGVRGREVGGGGDGGGGAKATRAVLGLFVKCTRRDIDSRLGVSLKVISLFGPGTGVQPGARWLASLRALVQWRMSHESC